jgi:hypothetical protein
VDSQPTDPRAVESHAFIRILDANEKGLRDERARRGKRFSSGYAVRWCLTRAGPISPRFAVWLAEPSHAATPRRLFKQAVNSDRNQ